MSSKRRVSLLGFVAMIVTAFAVPASASASQWTNEGNPLIKPAELDISGWTSNLPVSGGLYGLKCDDIDGKLKLLPGDTAEVTQMTYANCKGYGWDVTVTPNGLPWDLEIDDITYGYPIVYTDDVSVTAKYPPAGGGGSQKVESWWRLFPDDSEAFSSFEIHGYASTFAASERGNFSVLQAGSYGIE
jgi:hypothetical protein